MNNCIQCGITTINKKFCSNNCKWTNIVQSGKLTTKGKSINNKNQVILECINCKKHFSIRRSRLGVRKFCSRDCDKNNRFVHKGDYKRISLGKGKYIYEHRHIMEQHINRKLLTSELVHHINGNKRDNRIENLAITDRRSHPITHYKVSFAKEVINK